jgi:hypothetical protein
MLKKLIAAGATLAVALGIVALATAPAQAHSAAITTSVACSTATPGQSVITWKISNDYDLDATIYKVSGSAAGQLTPDPLNQTLPRTNGGPNTFKTFTQTVDGTASFTLNAWVRWTDGYDNNGNPYSATAAGKASCTIGTPVGSVTAQQPKCDTVHPGSTTDGSYTITAGRHVSYTASVNGAAATAVSAGVAIPVAVGGSAVTVVINPKADSGYTLTGYVASQWTLYFAPVTIDCRQAATPPTVTPTPAICAQPGVPGTGTVSITGVDKSVIVSYSTDGKNGTYTTITADKVVTVPAQTTVWVEVAAQPGYIYATTLTSYNVGGPVGADCVSPQKPAVNQAVCNEDEPGTVPEAYYVIPTVAGVVYKDATDKVLAAGKHDVTVNTTDVIVKVFASSTTGYAFPGSPNPTEYDLVFSHLSSAGCVLAADIGVPTFTEAVCNADHPGTLSHGASYTLPVATGVIYDVKVNNGELQQDVTPGNYPVNQGDTVLVTERADTGFTLSGDYPVNGYTKTFSTTAGDCTVPVTPVASATDETCTQDSDGFAVFTDGSIKVTVMAHVTYAIDGTPVDTTGAKVGDVVSTTVKHGSHTVSVMTDTGYTVTGWPKVLTVQEAKACGQLPDHALVIPTFDPKQAGCFTSASFTLGELNGNTKDVIWTVNGSTVNAGTYPAKVGATYTAVAAAAKGNGIDPSVTTTTFTFTPTASSSPCDLKTLALTGTGNPTGWIGLGYLLLVIGLALAAVPLIRRRRTAVLYPTDRGRPAARGC